MARNAYEVGWPSWRGLAIEPVVREAVLRLAPTVPALNAITDVAPWWNRDNSVKVDLVASAGPSVAALGSIKWRERRRFSVADMAELAATRSVVPRAGQARLVVVCPAGVDGKLRADVALTADDLLHAWT